MDKADVVPRFELALRLTRLCLTESRTEFPEED